jgi:hypothetical protein
MILVYNLDREIARIKLVTGQLVITRGRSPAIELLIDSMRQFEGRELSDQELYASLPIRLKGRIWAGYKKGSKEAHDFEARLKAGKMRWRD